MCQIEITERAQLYYRQFDGTTQRPRENDGQKNLL